MYTYGKTIKLNTKYLYETIVWLKMFGKRQKNLRVIQATLLLGKKSIHVLEPVKRNHISKERPRTAVAVDLIFLMSETKRRTPSEHIVKILPNIIVNLPPLSSKESEA